MDTYTVAVRTLCEFAAKQGDLDHRFTPSPSATEGVAGHRAVAARRADTYRCEVTLTGRYKTLQVRGRADGYCPDAQRLDEVKTFRGDLSRMPANHRVLHWAQAKVYGALLCRELGLARLAVALVYFDVDAQEEAEPLVEHCEADALQRFFEDLCERFIAWADAERAHRHARDAALAALRFPHESFRAGQHDLARAVYNAARSGRCLLAQAPTGIGKTIATVFPMLKACATQGVDKVFFLTAKGSGRGLARQALAALHAGDAALPLRTIELVARDKACEHPDKACHGESCPLARGFYDRLPAAREAAVSEPGLTRESLREIALAHAVCPYYLAQEMTRWSDVVIGDYNHFYDTHALLFGLQAANDWKVGVLVDEAHNLLDRARGMYSASLSSVQLQAVRRLAPAAIAPALQRLQRHWTRWLRPLDDGHAIFDKPPSAWVSALREASEAVSTHLAEPGVAAPERAVLDFHFEVLAFLRLVESFGAHSLFDVTRETRPGQRGPDSTLGIRNVLPAPFLKPRHRAAHSTTLFSATLAPAVFQIDTLGLPEDTAWVDVPAPFRAEQLTVHIARQVSTRYADRARSIGPIVERMAAQYREAPGNYIAFFSSFDYLAQAAAQFAAEHASVPTWTQTRRMSDAEREAFLARFVEGGRGIGFAVLGGAFAEGVDLVGTRLIGAFVTTLGLPQVNPFNEAVRRRLDTAFAAGFDYTYLYPGLRKVVQAAGRVVRTTSDVGVVHLIDDRFARPDVRALLPPWWTIAPDGPAPADASRQDAREH